jgi:thiol-disulfide isomerase/thioredoxin
MPARSARASVRNFPVRRRLFWLSVAAVTTVILVSVAIANRSVPPAATDAPPLSALSVGDPAPAFSIATTQGAFSLARVDRPVFLEVFATWCPHCQHETVALNKLFDKYKNRVTFVAVSGSPYGHDRTTPESMADVLAFEQFFHVRYPIAFDGSLAVAKQYLQGGYPTIAILGLDKRVEYLASGEITEAELDSQIRSALSKR